MIIEISSAEILHRVRDIAQDELAVTIPDETLRYKIEPGSEKEDKVKTFISSSVEDFCALAWRFLSDESQQRYGWVENSEVVLPERYCFKFDVSERRAAGKASIITNKSASYLVENTLQKYYLSIGQVALAQNHAQQASAEMNLISTLLYTKALP